MTKKEEEIINELLRTVRELKAENAKYREDVTSQISAINLKVNKAHEPIAFESDILKVTQHAINESISKVLTGYDSPLLKLVKSVVDEYSPELRKIISESFGEVISLDEFKQSIVNAFSHKVARTIISNNDGLFDKVSNELKQDAIFKSKMSLAVSNVVEECLSIKGNKEPLKDSESNNLMDIAFIDYDDEILEKAFKILFGDIWKASWSRHDKANEMRSILNENLSSLASFKSWVKTIEFLNSNRKK